MPARNPLTIVLGLLLLAMIIELLRRRRLREKYAAIWLLVSGVILVLAVFPSILFWLADVLGFGVPSNLLFFMGGVVLLFVSLQLSIEVGRLEDESQRLAEEVAILRGSEPEPPEEP